MNLNELEEVVLCIPRERGVTGWKMVISIRRITEYVLL